MGAVATFSYKTWAASFPELSGVSEPQAQSYFDRATAFLDNTGKSPVQTVTRQLSLLNLLTAHIAWLTAPRDANGNPTSSGVAAPQVVGRITNASEGSVSVQVDAQYAAPGSAQWYAQSRYGAEYYAATAAYRQMKYWPRPQRVYNGVFPSR